MNLRWNKNEKSSLCREYRKRSKYFFQRQQKSVQDFKREISQTYNIEAL